MSQDTNMETDALASLNEVFTPLSNLPVLGAPSGFTTYVATFMNRSQFEEYFSRGRDDPTHTMNRFSSPEIDLGMNPPNRNRGGNN